MSLTQSSEHNIRLPGAESSAFWAAFVGLLLLAIASAPAGGFPHDSSGYWALPQSFVRDGEWSLLHLADVYRGYVPALLYGVVRTVVDLTGISAQFAVQALNAGLFALIGAVLLPRLGEHMWRGMGFTVVRRLAIVLLFALFWHGYLHYPLTDFPALAAGLGSLVLIARPTLARGLAAGLLAGAAMNLRPAYLLLAIGVVAIALAASDVRRRTYLAAAAMAAVGLLAVSLPQIAINQHNHQRWSPLPGAAADLGSFQLTAGLQMQLYGTYVGDAYGPQMPYGDPAGAELLNSASLDAQGRVRGFGDYVSLGLKDPMAMAGVFWRHVVNGLDQRYATPYTAELDNGERRPWRLAGFLIVFAALARICWPASRRQLADGGARWSLAFVLVLACATSLPSAMEQRFMLPVFALALLLIVAPGWPAVLSPREAAGARVRRFVPALAIAAAGVVFLVLVFRTSANTTEQLRMPPPVASVSGQQIRPATSSVQDYESIARTEPGPRDSTRARPDR